MEALVDGALKANNGALVTRRQSGRGATARGKLRLHMPVSSTAYRR